MSLFVTWLPFLFGPSSVPWLRDGSRRRPNSMPPAPAPPPPVDDSRIGRDLSATGRQSGSSAGTGNRGPSFITGWPSKCHGRSVK